MALVARFDQLDKIEGMSIQWNALPSNTSGTSALATSPVEWDLVSQKDLWGPVPEYEDLMPDLMMFDCKLVPFASGRFGKIFRGQYSGRNVALKVLQPRSLDDVSEELATKIVQKEFFREVSVLSTLEHESIVSILGVFRWQGNVSEGPKWCILLEYFAMGSLCSWLRRRREDGRKSPPSLSQSLGMAFSIANAMEYIHSKGLVHRDLKSSNILVTAEGVAKVADFGTARVHEGKDEMTGEAGTFRWMAPEMMGGESYSHKADVYSFGVVLWELITGDFPWEGLSCVQVAFAVACEDLRPTIPTGCPRVLAEMIEDCWRRDPDLRPEFSEIRLRLSAMKAALASDPSLRSLAGASSSAPVVPTWPSSPRSPQTTRSGRALKSWILKHFALKGSSRTGEKGEEGEERTGEMGKKGGESEPSSERRMQRQWSLRTRSDGAIQPRGGLSRPKSMSGEALINLSSHTSFSASDLKPRSDILSTGHL